MHRPAVSTVSFIQPMSIKQFINLHILFRRASSSSRHQRLLFCLRCCLLLFSLLHYAISLLASSNFAAVLCYFAVVLCYFAVVLFYFAAAIYFFAAALFNIDSEILLSRCTSSISMKLCSLAAPRLFRWTFSVSIPNCSHLISLLPFFPLKGSFGTGMGCLGLSLACFWKGWTVLASLWPHIGWDELPRWLGTVIGGAALE